MPSSAKLPNNSKPESRLQLPKFTVESFSSLELLQQENKRLVPKGLSASAFQRAWEAGFTGKDVVVAVIDTGVDGNHPDLRDKVIKAINLTGEPITESHGTHVAGTIAANGWLIGGAYDSKIVDIKALGYNGGSISNIIKAIGLAVSNGASVVNMSLGGSGLTNNDIQGLTTAIQEAWNNGCICVAASGNSGTSICTPDTYEYPASIEKSESVAACDVSDNLDTISLAPFSNENNRVDLGACGVNIVSTVIDSKYAVYSGTSMSTPHVSAMAAILVQSIKSKYPTLTGSTFSSNLVSLLHSNVLKIDGCSPVTTVSIKGKTLLEKMGNPNCPSSTLDIKRSPGYTSALTKTVSVQYSNISFGLGFLRYEPTNGPYNTTAEKFFSNGVYLGNLVDLPTS